jgi:hypothetical protein
MSKRTDIGASPIIQQRCMDSMWRKSQEKAFDRLLIGYFEEDFIPKTDVVHGEPEKKQNRTMTDLKKLTFCEKTQAFAWSEREVFANGALIMECGALEYSLFMAYIKGRSEGLTTENVLKYAWELNEFINNAIDVGIDFNFIEK